MAPKAKAREAAAGTLTAPVETSVAPPVGLEGPTSGGMGIAGAAGVGSADLGVFVPLGEGRATTPWTNVDRITLHFGSAVAVDRDALTVRGVSHAMYSAGDFQCDPDTRTGTWTFASAFPADRLTFEFGESRWQLAVAPGDVDGAGTVNAADLVKVRNRVGGSTLHPGSGVDAYNVFPI